MNDGRLVLVLLVAFAAAACDSNEGAEPAPLGSLPLAGALPGAAIGPQPGPDRAMPPVVNPFAGQPNALVEGRRLFVWFNCAGCHGGHAGGGMGPSLRDVAWIYGHSDQAIYNSIAEGRAHGMPAWGTKLPSEQIWKLVTYIKSMGTDAEPMQPPQNRSYPHPPPRREIPGQEADEGGG